MKTKDYFKSTTFFYNNLFLKKVLEYNLTTQEFILLNYFINMHETSLDISKVEKYTFLSSDDILSAYNGLIEKKVISILVKKNSQGMMEESISFDRFISDIERDFNSKEKDVSVDKLINKYSEYKTSKANDEEVEIINTWVRNGFTYEEILKAFEDANYNGIFNIRYIDKFLNEKTTSSEKDEDNKLFDYDWLSEE